MNCDAVTRRRDVGQAHEVIVVNDASTDTTGEGDRRRGVQVIDVGHRHIAATRNAGARAARGDILFFVDADTRANAGVLAAGLKAIAQAAVGGGCHFRYDGPIPWRARLLLPVGNAACRLLTVCGGAFMFCRRDEFEAVGGFCEQYFAAEDAALVKAAAAERVVIRSCCFSFFSGNSLLLTSVSARWIIARMSRPRHPNKHIEKAIRYAESLDWRVEISGGHAWGRLFCPQSGQEGCIVSVWSTPRKPENHARHIWREVDLCPHSGDAIDDEDADETERNDDDT